MSIASDGSLAAAGTEGGVVTLWDVATGELVGELAGHNPDWQVLPVAFSPDSRSLASGFETGEAIIWDVDSQSLLQRIHIIDDVLFALAFSPDGQTLAAGGKSNSVWLFDVASGELNGTLPGLPNWVFDLAFNADGSQLLLGSRDGSVMLWDVASHRLQQTFYGEAGFALGVAFVDRATAVASYNTGNVRVWDLADGRVQQRYALADFMPSFAQSPDRLAAAGLNNAIRLLNTESGETVHELTLEPGAESLLDSGNVTALAFNPSGTELVSGTGDGRLFLWDVASGEMARRLNEHTAFVHHVVFSPDGRLFLSVSDDARLIL